MILQVEKFQDSCKKILSAVDTDSALKNVIFGYDTIELKANGKTLELNVTNGEYFVSVMLPLEEEATLRAVVEAKLFLTLISKITTKTVELSTDDKSLVVKANGTYRFPLKFDVDKMVVLPKIDISNVTTEFTVDSAILNSILTNNSREIDLDGIRAVQKLYYLDEVGCLTFTNSTACVNSFTLSQPIKIFLAPKVVKLFKLFSNGDVKLTLGYAEVGTMLQTRLALEQDNVLITSILPNEQNSISTVPVDAVRGRANKALDFNVCFDKKYFLEALDRILLFDTTSLNKGVGVFEFGPESVKIFDARKNNSEVVAYVNSSINGTYTANLDLETIKSILSLYDTQVFSMKFGDNQAVVLSYGNIKNVLAQKALR